MRLEDFGNLNLGEVGGEMENEIESQAGGSFETLEEMSSESQRGLGKNFAEWGQLHTEILEAWLVDEDEWGGEAMVALGKRLRCDLDDFAFAMGEIPEEVRNMKRAERLLEAERIRNVDINWDRLEEAVLSKLDNHVRNTKNLKIGEMLSIAQVANRATRRTRTQGDKSMGSGNTFINLNAPGGSQTQVSLPGPGQLGSMTLTLSPRVVSQLGQGITTIDGELEKFSESIEMLDGKDVGELSKLADGT